MFLLFCLPFAEFFAGCGYIYVQCDGVVRLALRYGCLLRHHHTLAVVARARCEVVVVLVTVKRGRGEALLPFTVDFVLTYKRTVL